MGGNEDEYLTEAGASWGAPKYSAQVVSTSSAFSGIVPPNGGTWQEFVGGLDDAATPAKYNHHWS